MNPDQKRKSILLQIVAVVGLVGLFVIHNTWLGKEPPPPQPDDGE